MYTLVRNWISRALDCIADFFQRLSISLDRRVLLLLPPGHPDRYVSLTRLASNLSNRYGRPRTVEDLNEAILFGREALELCPQGSPNRSTPLKSLAGCLSSRYKELGSVEDLDESIVLGREALVLRPPGHPEREMSSNTLATYLASRYNQFGVLEDINEAIHLCRDALALYPQKPLDRITSLNNITTQLSSRYKVLGSVEDLNEAILYARNAMALCPPGQSERVGPLNNLATGLATRYKRFGESKDLDEAIDLSRDALALCPPGHSIRSTLLNNLAVYLSSRYHQLGALEDVNEAILFGRGALELCTPKHPDRSMMLDNLAVCLSSRYTQLGTLEDLNEAILLGRDALALRPPGHPERPTSLGNLVGCLSSHYKELGLVEDLNEAIVFGRDALANCPPGHTERSRALNNLALSLSSRHKLLRALEDLNETISLARDALELCPPGHPYRVMPLNNLALGLSTRYNQLGTVEDLDEAIFLCREALHTQGDLGQSISFSNLASNLFSRYMKLDSVTDLNEAITLDRDALALHPPGYPDRLLYSSNLAVHLFARYKELGSVEDLNDAIVLGRDTVALRPPGHPDRSLSLSNLASYLRIRFTQSGQLDDKKEVFNLYAGLADAPPMVSFGDLSAAREWTNVAEDFRHPSTLLAYQTALRFLVHHLATLPSLPQHHTALRTLTSSLAVDAFSACLRNRSPTNAVELLEQGRGVFWNQLARLRSPIDDVITSGPVGRTLANEFTRLTSLIRSVLDSPSAGQHDRVCNLNVELETVVTKIRALPGLSHFLLPLAFSELQQAARRGPVIIVNASKYGCDALIVLVDRDPVHISLPITKDGVQNLSARLAILTLGAKSSDLSRDFYLLLRELWDDVVSPIVDVLLTIHLPRSRIWWCPTAEFTSLPLHAAAPYRKGQQSLASLYVSSYTPTLSALIRARHHGISRSPLEEKRFLAIGEANAAGEDKLHSVGTELTIIGQYVNDLATFTRLEGEESSIARVTSELNKNEWVHLACHGKANRTKPFESAFALHDGYFTIEHIIRCKLEDPQFAYLSACHTTVGDKESPDEVIHLASAMQFAGFRSVIGTMWAVDDAVTNRVASMFYENMKDERGRLDYTRAALALNVTMEKLRDIPFDQRILYIHLGA